MLRYGATFFEDPQQEKTSHPPPGAEGAVVKQRQQQRPGQGFTGGDEQIAVVELLLGELLYLIFNANTTYFLA